MEDIEYSYMCLYCVWYWDLFNIRHYSIWCVCVM